MEKTKFVSASPGKKHLSIFSFCDRNIAQSSTQPYLSRQVTFLLKMTRDRKRLRDLEKSSNCGLLWIITRLWETAHLLSLKSILTLTSQLGQNVGLGEGKVGSFPQT